MTDDTQWTDWIPHVAGDPCPIPDAKAGEYCLRFDDGEDELGEHEDAIWWASDPSVSDDPDCWKGYEERTITHYRLRKPPVDWKGIANDLAAALIAYEEYLDVPQDRGGANGRKGNAFQKFIEGKGASLTHYREAIK